MADDLIQCPSCSFRLRLPAELSGQEVECPQCHTRFAAPAPTATRPPPGREYDAVARPVDGEPVPSSGSSLTAPAMCLLITGLLSCGCCALGLLWAQAAESDPAEFERVMKRELDKNRDLKPEERRQMEEMLSLDNITRYLRLDCGGSLVLNVITVLGAIQMLRRRTYALAVIGSIVALNPANVPCCMVQVPFGIWGLIVLLGSAKHAFR